MHYLASQIFSSMAPLITWTQAPSVEEVARSWDGHHIVHDNTLMVFRRGAPYDDWGRSKWDVYCASFALEADVERQVALLVPAPEAANWRPFARIVEAPLKSWDDNSAFSHTIVVDTTKKI